VVDTLVGKIRRRLDLEEGGKKGRKKVSLRKASFGLERVFNILL